MKRSIQQAFTGRDNVTVDVVRVLAVVSFVVGIGLEIFVVGWKALRPDATVSFDLQAYGIGLGALFATVGVALKLKADTEPTESTTLTSKSETTVTETR